MAGPSISVGVGAYVGIEFAKHARRLLIVIETWLEFGFTMHNEYDAHTNSHAEFRTKMNERLIVDAKIVKSEIEELVTAVKLTDAEPSGFDISRKAINSKISDINARIEILQNYPTHLNSI